MTIKEFGYLMYMDHEDHKKDQQQQQYNNTVIEKDHFDTEIPTKTENKLKKCIIPENIPLIL